MIVARLALHNRKIRNAAGRASGLYSAIITMLVESSALYAITFLLYIIPWSMRSGAQFIFFPILAGAQVCADTVERWDIDLLLRGRTGYRPVPNHSTSRQSKSINERACRLRAPWVASF